MERVSSHQLDINDFNKIYTECLCLSFKWDQIGVYLDAPRYVINNIEADRTSNSRRLSELLSQWLKRWSKDQVLPSWRVLCEAIVMVDRNAAEKIASNYQCSCSKCYVPNEHPQKPTVETKQTKRKTRRKIKISPADLSRDHAQLSRRKIDDQGEETARTTSHPPSVTSENTDSESELPVVDPPWPPSFGNDLQTANEDQQLKRRHKHSNKPDVRAFNTQTEDGISGSWWEKRQLCCILIFLGVVVAVGMIIAVLQLDPSRMKEQIKAKLSSGENDIDHVPTDKELLQLMYDIPLTSQLFRFCINLDLGQKTCQEIVDTSPNDYVKQRDDLLTKWTNKKEKTWIDFIVALAMTDYCAQARKLAKKKGVLVTDEKVIEHCPTLTNTD